MKYTKYFGFITKEQGQINLPPDQFQRMMNILSIPVNYGEFGVCRQTNTVERNTDLVRGYYKTFDDATLSQGMSYSVWDDRGWFGLINSTRSGFINNIVPYRLK